jgi:hypothetical protein
MPDMTAIGGFLKPCLKLVLKIPPFLVLISKLCYHHFGKIRKEGGLSERNNESFGLPWTGKDFIG